MTITEKLSTFHAKCQQVGYSPLTVGVSNEEYAEYHKSLRDMTEFIGLAFTDKPAKLFYKGIELVKYGPQHSDSKLS